MHRRTFIKSSLFFSTLAALRGIPCFGKAGPYRERNIFTDPPAIEPIMGALQSFHPLESGSLKAGEWRLNYDLIRWHEIGDTGVPLNIKDGRLQVHRTGNADTGVYHIGRQMSLPTWQFKGRGRVQECFLEAKIQTFGENESAHEWRCTTFNNEPGEDTPAQPNSCGTIEGTYDGQKVRLSTEKVLLSERQLTGTLLSTWLIPELLLRNSLSRSTPLNFTLLEDGLNLRRDQQLAYDGAVGIETADGILHCDIWLQTGAGILPIHWIVDSHGCPQIMTHSALNLMLSDVG